VEYNSLVKQAREFEGAGDISEAVKYYELAQEINDTDIKLSKKISKLRTLLVVRRQSMLQQQIIESTEENPVQEGWEYDSERENVVLLDHPEFSLSEKAYQTLLPYQREGVAWLCDLHMRAQGGILGDDMGLGKTCQTITFVNAAFQCSLVKRVLIVAPVSVLNVWTTEFAKFGKDVLSRVHSFYGTNVRERNRNLDHVSVHGGVCFTSYGLCANNAERLSQTKWDYL
jgi:SNF2 family DNA or RNA helicase